MSRWSVIFNIYPSHDRIYIASQFLHQTRLIHLQAVILKALLLMGSSWKKNPSNSLTLFSDSDWAGCTATRRFTSEFCIFLGVIWYFVDEKTTNYCALKLQSWISCPGCCHCRCYMDTISSLWLWYLYIHSYSCQMW